MIDIHKMEAVILCGGLGTRLREETEFKPKPMVEIGGYPIVWHIMRRYAMFGVRRFILCLGYKGNIIRDYFLNYRCYHSDFTVNLKFGSVDIHGRDVEDWEIVLADTGENTQTGSRIARALPHIKNERFFATYGDGVAKIDINALYQHHTKKKLLATLTAVHPSSRYGEIKIEDGHVNYFAEKPQVTRDAINGGYFVFEKEVFRKYGPADPFKQPDVFLETGILEALANDQQLAAYQHGDFWQCMDTFREMQMLNRMWEEGNAPWAS